jgi:hypothetical protein
MDSQLKIINTSSFCFFLLNLPPLKKILDPPLDVYQGFPTLDPRIHLAPRRGFCGSAEELQKK